MLSLELVPLTQSLWPTPTGAGAWLQPRYSTFCSDRSPAMLHTSERRCQGSELIFLLFRAPTDCVQWFTGTTGTFWFLEKNLHGFQFICPFPLHSLEESTVDSALSLNVSKIQDVAGAVKSYNFAGSQLLQSQYYTNCIRTEQGYCAIQWKESSSTSPDPFGVGSTITQVESDGCDGLNGFILIPNLSQDGIQKLPIPVSTTYAFQSQVCGSNFGIEGMGTIAQPLVSKWFVLTPSLLQLEIMIYDWQFPPQLGSSPSFSGFTPPPPLCLGPLASTWTTLRWAQWGIMVEKYQILTLFICSSHANDQ